MKTRSLSSKKTHNYPLLTAIALAALSAFPVTGKSAELFKDTFTDVKDLNAAKWFTVGMPSGTPWGTGQDSTAPLSGTVLENLGSSSGWQHVVRPFPATTLSKTGDSLTLKMDFRADSNTDGGFLDVALLNCAKNIDSNSFTDEAGNPLLNAKGYSAFQVCKTVPTENSFRKIANAASAFDAPKKHLKNNSVVLTALQDDTKAHTLLLTLTKGESGTEMTWSIDGVVVGSATDVDTSFDTFNTISLLAVSSNPVHFDNIAVSTNDKKP